MTGDSISALLDSGSQTTMATSAAISAARDSCVNSTEPGQSMNVHSSSRNLVVAMFSSVLIWRARASSEESPTVLPSLTEPRRGIASQV